MKCRLCGRLLNQFDAYARQRERYGRSGAENEGEGEKKMTLEQAQELYEAAYSFYENEVVDTNSPLYKSAQQLFHVETVNKRQLHDLCYIIFKGLAKEHMTIHHAVPEPSKAEAPLATIKHLLGKIRNIQLLYENNRSEILKFANYGLTSDFPLESLMEIQKLAQCHLRYRKEEKKNVEIAGFLMKKAVNLDDLESLKGFYDN